MPKPKAKEGSEKESVVEVATDATVVVTHYRVFDTRANVVAQVTDVKEAEKIAETHKGFYKVLS